MTLFHSFCLFQIFAVAYSSNVVINNENNVCQLVSQLLNQIKVVHPNLLKKPKLHILTHLADDIRDFGPAVGFSTERYSTTIQYMYLGLSYHYPIYQNTNLGVVAVRFLMFIQLHLYTV